MKMRNAFILTNYIANTVPNFYLTVYECFIGFFTSSKCLIFRHECQGIRHLSMISVISVFSKNIHRLEKKDTIKC